MPLTITFLGHSAFLLSDGSTTVAIDPFLTGNPVASHTPGQIDAKHIILTHGHPDHVGDTVAIANRNGATVYAVFELANFMSEQGVEKTEWGNTGGRIDTEFGWMAFTPALHSSSYEGRYMGMPCGVIVHMGGTTVCHCGDTALFSDMRMIGEYYTPHVAMIPVGDRGTMGPRHGAKAAELIRPSVAIPMHYGTFPFLTSDISNFKPTGVEVKVMEPGEVWQYGG